MNILIPSWAMTFLGVHKWNKLTSYCLQGPHALGTDLCTVGRKVQEAVTESLGEGLVTLPTFSYDGTSTGPDLKSKQSQLLLMKMAMAPMPIGLHPTTSAHSNMKLQWNIAQMNPKFSITHQTY